jgi:hypothetical protein
MECVSDEGENKILKSLSGEQHLYIPINFQREAFVVV